MAKQEELELREPDPFLKATIQFWERVNAHRREIGVGLLVLALGVVIFAGVAAHQESARVQAGAALSEALKVASRPVQSASQPAPETTSPDEAPFKTDAEKQTALVAALTDVRTKHPGTEAATAALLPLADAQLKLGHLDDAQKAYGEYVQASTSADPLRGLAQLGLAKIAEEKKDWNAAEAAYEGLQRDAPHTFLKDEAALGKARALEMLGKKQEAAAAYAEVRDGFQGTDAAHTATERLAVLAQQGIQPPAKPAPAPVPGNAAPAQGAPAPAPKAE